MPWRNTSIMEERVFFINEYRSGIWTMTELCKKFGISRPLGYMNRPGFTGGYFT